MDVAELGDIGSETVDVVAQRGDAVDKTILALASDAGHGLYLNAMFRGGVQIPWGPDTVVRRGDVLRVTGSRWRIKTLEAHMGRVVRASVSTDIVTLALGVSAGSLLGALTIPIGGLKLAMGSAVGLLLVGIVLSIVRTRQPGFGRTLPRAGAAAARRSGPQRLRRRHGPERGRRRPEGALGGRARADPDRHASSSGSCRRSSRWLVGAYLFKMNGALLLGAVAGGRCNSAGLRAAQETSQSNVPALSYPVTFALSNVVLTVMTYVFAMID